MKTAAAVALIFLGMTLIPLQATPALAARSPGIASSPEALLASGQSYFSGKATPGNYAKGLELIRLAAEAGLAEARLAMGAIYENGLGVPQDYHQAARWYLMATEQENPYAYYQMWELYRKARLPSEGIRYRQGGFVSERFLEGEKWKARAKKGLEKEARKRSFEAMYRLGELCNHCIGASEEELAESLHWFRRAAQGGHAEALKNLSALYKWEEGLPATYAEAESYGIGAAPALTEEDYRYLVDPAVQNNLILCYMWLGIAVEGEEWSASPLLAALEKEMSSDQIAEARRRIGAWWENHRKE